MAKVKRKTTLNNCNYEAQSYCFKNSLIIYPEEHNGMFKVRCDFGSKHKYYKEGKTYSMWEAYQSIWELYTEIYNNRTNAKRNLTK